MSINAASMSFACRVLTNEIKDLNKFLYKSNFLRFLLVKIQFNFLFIHWSFITSKKYPEKTDVFSIYCGLARMSHLGGRLCLQAVIIYPMFGNLETILSLRSEIINSRSFLESNLLDSRLLRILIPWDWTRNAKTVGDFTKIWMNSQDVLARLAYFLKLWTHSKKWRVILPEFFLLLRSMKLNWCVNSYDRDKITHSAHPRAVEPKPRPQPHPHELRRTPELLWYNKRGLMYCLRSCIWNLMLHQPDSTAVQTRNMTKVHESTL